MRPAGLPIAIADFVEQRVVAAVILLTLLAGLAMAGLRRRHRRNRSPS